MLFSNDLYAPKKGRILHNENLTSNKKKFGYQDFNERSADMLIFAYTFEIQNKKNVISDKNFEI